MGTQTHADGRPREDRGRGRRPHAQEGPALPTPACRTPGLQDVPVNVHCWGAGAASSTARVAAAAGKRRAGPRPAEPTLPGARGAGRPPAGAGGFTPHPTARVTPARHPSPGGHLCIIVPARKVHGEGRWPWPFLREKGGARRGCRVRLATVTVTVSGESSDTAPKCLKPRTMPTKRLVRAVRGRRAPRLRTLTHDWPHLF